MGLTIHYELSVSENLKVAVVRELVQRVAHYVEKIGCAEVGQVRRAAGEHGWQHFPKCHKQIISLLDFWRDLGVQVEVNDEGGYWETRSEQTLRQRLEQYDGLIASVAGMFKDASGAPDGPFRVESPILDYANFERLEHEGRQRFGGRVEELRKKCREGLF